MNFTINGKTLVLPALIPSISSFETQINPASALDLQAALSEPITLVSAYDLSKNNGLVEKVEQFRAQGRIVLMDSGGYESSRINRYAPDPTRWTFDMFKACVQNCETDLVASFDHFLEDGQKFSDYETDFLSFLQDHDFVGSTKLIPVIHLQDYLRNYVFSKKEMLEICDRISSEFDPEFIAIPERELGSGIAERMENVKAITTSFSEKGRKTKLHVLGCGNPLSFALLSYAGATLADGLEWCRTLVAEDFKLHHFQQAELFEEPNNTIYNPAAELFNKHAKSDYVLNTLVRNLYGLQQFNIEVASLLSVGHLDTFLEENFGSKPASLVRQNK